MDWNYAEWAERQGRENLRGRLATGDALLAQANTLLAVLMAAITGLMAAGVRVFDAPTLLAWGCLCAAAWLAVVGVALVARCIATRETPALFNEPDNVYRPDLGYSQRQVLEAEMGALQLQINAAKARNAGVALWLDRCRFAVLATPLVFALAAAWAA